MTHKEKLKDLLLTHLIKIRNELDNEKESKKQRILLAQIAINDLYDEVESRFK